MTCAVLSVVHLNTRSLILEHTLYCSQELINLSSVSDYTGDPEIPPGPARTDKATSETTTPGTADLCFDRSSNRRHRRRQHRITRVIGAANGTSSGTKSAPPTARNYQAQVNTRRTHCFTWHTHEQSFICTVSRNNIRSLLPRQ